MTGLAEMLRRVLVRAGVAATDVTTLQTHAQMRPGGLAELGALLAAARCDRLRFGKVSDGPQMLAGAQGRLAPP
jgi:hypothetical protein